MKPLVILLVASATVYYVMRPANIHTPAAPVLAGYPQDRQAVEELDRQPWGSAGSESRGEIEVGVPSWRSPLENQTYYVVDFRTVHIATHQRSSTSHQWGDPEWTTGSASFDIRASSSAGIDTFFFGGIAGNGDVVIERWKLKDATNPPIGNPLSGTIPRFRKTEIYRGPLAEQLRLMEADPEARFVIALAGDDSRVSLYRLTNVESASPVELLNSDAIPELLFARFMNRLEHAVLGRVWSWFDNPVLYDRRDSLIDSDNNGVFEGAPIVGDIVFFASADIDVYDYWLDDFLGPGE